MERAPAFTVFDSLTDKQHETLRLAASHLTSKQIARELGVAPITIDKRIESVRARLSGIARPDLLRLYTKWLEAYGRAIDDPTILGQSSENGAENLSQPSDPALTFADSLTFDGRAEWERDQAWLRPGLNPSDLGVGGKLLVILGGAVAIMMVAVLSVAFANALRSFF